MDLQGITLVMIPEAELTLLKKSLQSIQQQLNNLNSKEQTTVKHITAIEFMAAVRIRRTKFDELVKFGKIRVVKKLRKIYVPVEEVDRYFSDSTIC
jgi:predicted sugar kinase